ncbi:MAG TPA: isoprenylcysteine carboxylmethyltransferase family protein [Opitutaceae bacterium]|nr:isoprenylcysteine carboxylmethyltransferase family protein [Opitutaceae bacterium]
MRFRLASLIARHAAGERSPWAKGVAVPAGLGFVAWAAFEQWRVGRGTPVQCAPTQRLITSGPYARCRNPIEFGAVLYYVGLGTLLGSLFHGLVLGALGLVLGSAFHRTVEERELEQRFGEAYLRYRQATPFLFPRLGRRKR